MPAIRQASRGAYNGHKRSGSTRDGIILISGTNLPWIEGLPTRDGCTLCYLRNMGEFRGSFDWVKISGRNHAAWEGPTCEIGGYSHLQRHS